MKIKYFDTEIECTVDEFEDMIARGIFKSKVKPEEFIHDLIRKDPPAAPKWPETVALYGCQVPADQIKLDLTQPLTYNNCSTEHTGKSNDTEKDIQP